MRWRDREWAGVKASAGPVAAVVGAVALAVVVGYQVGGSSGVRVVAIVVEAIALIRIRAALPPRRSARPRVVAPDVNAGFVRYRQLVALLRPAGASRVDFDRSVRPVLLRLYAQTLAARYGVTLSSRDRDRARTLMGDAAWLLDDSVGDVEESDAAPLDARQIELLTSRLEELSS
ncbi:MAG TPA: hypothetical protein VF218_14175 [Acidothermaceae bacterium]|jgi:hypothetical protein